MAPVSLSTSASPPYERHYLRQLRLALHKTRERALRRSLDDALDCVGGYSIFNDGSLRDYQRRSTQWTIGKNFDATGPLGP